MNKIQFFSLAKRFGIYAQDFKGYLFILRPNHRSLENKFMFSEMGPDLKVKIINFYINNLRKAGISEKEYCVKKDYVHWKIFKRPVNIFYYSEKCLNIIQECVYRLDILDALVNTNDSQAINKINKTWGEIKDGVSRLLKDKIRRNGKVILEKELNENEIQGRLIKGNEILFLHGHQFRKWIKGNAYLIWERKPKIVVLGHYHRMFPMKKYDTIILFGGHFKKMSNRMFQDFLLKHQGSISMKLSEDKNNHFQFLRF